MSKMKPLKCLVISRGGGAISLSKDFILLYYYSEFHYLFCSPAPAPKAHLCTHSKMYEQTQGVVRCWLTWLGYRKLWTAPRAQAQPFWPSLLNAWWVGMVAGSPEHIPLLESQQSSISGTAWWEPHRTSSLPFWSHPVAACLQGEKRNGF